MSGKFVLPPEGNAYFAVRGSNKCNAGDNQQS